MIRVQPTLLVDLRLSCRTESARTGVWLKRRCVVALEHVLCVCGRRRFAQVESACSAHWDLHGVELCRLQARQLVDMRCTQHSSFLAAKAALWAGLALDVRCIRKRYSSNIGGRTRRCATWHLPHGALFVRRSLLFPALFCTECRFPLNGLSSIRD